MAKSDAPKIHVEEIIQRIEKEIQGKREPSHAEADDRLGTTSFHPLQTEKIKFRSALHELIWKYGNKYATTIKKIPVLRNVARKQYWRLASIERSQSTPVHLPNASRTDLDFLGANWYYYDFFEQTKNEGIKGTIKRLILKSLGFHAWWQGQVNKAIYQELIRQKGIIEDKTRIIQEAVGSVQSDLNHNMEILKHELSDISQQIRDNRQQILGHQRSLKLLLEEVRKRTMEVLSADQIQEEEHLFNATDLAFMERFRGKREDLKERMNVYLPYILGVGGRGEPVLDIGCGRGEWLELCQENNLVAKGVDKDRAMANQCLELGFDVVEEDVIVFLSKQEANTFGAVTGFHLIEHLSYQTIIALFDEVLRVLKSGGIVIFETPNPENVLVGSCIFYTDPTHRTPLVPELVKFIGDQRGFVKTSILRLHKRSEPKYTGDPFVDELIYRFNMEQDYAFIGYKL